METRFTTSELDIIGIMKVRTVTRAQLCTMLGVGDRQAREWVARVKREYPVIASGHGKGYRIATSALDYEAAVQALRAERSKAIAIFEGQKALRAFVNAQAGKPYEQLTLNF